MHVGLAQVVPGTLRSTHGTCVYSYSVLMFTYLSHILTYPETHM